MAGMELRSSSTSSSGQHQRMTRQSTRQTSKATINIKIEKKYFNSSKLSTTSKVSSDPVNNDIITTTTTPDQEIKKNIPSIMPIRRSSRSISNHSDSSGSKKRPKRNAVLNSILKPAFAFMIEKRRSSAVKTYSRASIKNKNSTNSMSKILQSSSSFPSSTSQTIPNTTLSITDEIPIQNEEKLKIQQKVHHQVVEKIEKSTNKSNDDNQSIPITTTMNEEGNLEDTLEFDNQEDIDDEDELADKEFRNDKNNNNIVTNNQIIEDDDDDNDDDNFNISNLVNITSPLYNYESDYNNTQVSFVPDSSSDNSNNNNNNDTSDEMSKNSSITSIKVLSEHIENYLDYEIDIQIEEFFYCEFCGFNFINYEKFEDHKLKKCPENNEEIALQNINDDYADDDEQDNEQYAEDPLRIYEDECEFECSPIFSKPPNSSSTSLSCYDSDNNNNNQINSIIDKHGGSYSNNTNNNGTKYLFAASAFKYYITTTSVTQNNNNNNNIINHEPSEYDNDLLHMRTSAAMSYYNHEKSPDQECNTFSKITILPPDYYMDYNMINGGNSIISPATTKILVPLKNFMLNCKRPFLVLPTDNETHGEITPFSNITDTTTTTNNTPNNNNNNTTYNLLDSTMIEISPTTSNSSFIFDYSNSATTYTTSASVALTNNNTRSTSSSSSFGRRKNRKALCIKEESAKKVVVDPLNIDHTYFNHIEDKTENKEMITMDHKHKQHLTSEQLRRQNLRLLFQTLKQYMPKNYRLQQNSSKVMILNKSIEYIKSLESTERNCRVEKEQLVDRNQKLWDTFHSFSKDEREPNEKLHPALRLKPPT